MSHWRMTVINVFIEEVEADTAEEASRIARARVRVPAARGQHVLMTEALPDPPPNGLRAEERQQGGQP